MRRHASADRLGSGPLRLPHVRPTMAGGRARLVTGRCGLMRRASSVAGSRRRWLLVPGEGARAGLRWIAVDGGERALRERRARRSGSQDRRHEGRAGALARCRACDALKGSRVRRRWPLPETTERGARRRACSRSGEEEAQAQDHGRGADLRAPPPGSSRTAQDRDRE